MSHQHPDRRHPIPREDLLPSDIKTDTGTPDGSTVQSHSDLPFEVSSQPTAASEPTHLRNDPAPLDQHHPTESV